jgi:hypothetical protein
MKKLSSLCMLIAFMLIGCASFSGRYNLGLQEVERPANAQERYGEPKIVSFEEDGITIYSYEDDMIEIVWFPLSAQFSFILQNKTEHSLRIIWDEAVYVDENGSSGRVLHSGVRFIDRNNSQSPSIVAKNTVIDDIVVPAGNIYYESGQGEWRTAPLFENSASTQEELDALAQKYIGKTVEILLPLQIEETVNEYIFILRIESFIPRN